MRTSLATTWAIGLVALILFGFGGLSSRTNALPTVIFYPTPTGTRARIPTPTALPIPPTQAVIMYGSQAATETPLPLSMLVAPDRPAWGPGNAAVTVVEFADFQCPVCGVFSREFEPVLRARYQDRIRFMFRHFPLRSIHEHAQDAALAATCVSGDRDFWIYHDLLYSHQGDLSRAALLSLARQANARITDDQLTRCMDDVRTAAVVEADLQAGLTAGVRGTPTLFIDGRRVEGLQQLTVYTELIDQALGEAVPRDAHLVGRNASRAGWRGERDPATILNVRLFATIDERASFQLRFTRCPVQFSAVCLV